MKNETVQAAMLTKSTSPFQSLHDFAGAPSGWFCVPLGQRALVIRNGIPEQYCLSGEHSMPAIPGKVEVRLLQPDASRQAILAAPDFRALALPYERSFLYVDGELLGIFKPSPGDREGELKAWEGFQPPRGTAESIRGPLQTCLTERLRSCLPAAGVCCGARIAA